MTDSALLEKLKDVKDYNELLQVAFWYIEKNSLDTMVLGPIFSQGSDNTANNLDRLEAIISNLENQGSKIFSQIPFLDINLAQETQMHHFETEQKFHEFYFPLFRSGFIKTAYFISGWQNSKGASMEHGCCVENGIKIVYL